MEDLKRIIATKIYTLRNAYDLTQEEFTKRLNINVTREHISRIENGINVPSAEFIWDVAVTFNVDPKWLLGIPDIKTKENILDLTIAEIDLILKFRNLNEDNKFTISSLLDILSSRNNK